MRHRDFKKFLAMLLTFIFVVIATGIGTAEEANALTEFPTQGTAIGHNEYVRVYTAVEVSFECIEQSVFDLDILELIEGTSINVKDIYSIETIAQYNNNIVSEVTFILEETLDNFDVQLQEEDVHISAEFAITLLDENGNALGVVIYSSENDSYLFVSLMDYLILPMSTTLCPVFNCRVPSTWRRRSDLDFAASCTRPREEVWMCNDGHFTLTPIGSPLGHLWTAPWTVVTPATCRATGTERQICNRSNCTEPRTRSIPINPNNHSWSSWQFVGTNCTERRTCSRSGCTSTESRVTHDSNFNSSTVRICTRFVECGRLNTSNSNHFTHFMYRRGNLARHISGSWLWHSTHRAIDMSNGTGTSISGFPIYAQGAGTVVRVAGSSSSDAGFFIVIHYDNGYVARYLHVAQSGRATQGSRVFPQDRIATTSNTGTPSGGGSYAAHLHYDVIHINNVNDRVNFTDLGQSNANNINPTTLFPTGAFS
jgi:hypothetical protein